MKKYIPPMRPMVSNMQPVDYSSILILDYTLMSEISKTIYLMVNPGHIWNHICEMLLIKVDSVLCSKT